MTDCTSGNTGVQINVLLDVDYEVVTNPHKDRKYPIDIISAKFRGKDIYNLMFVTHVAELQRKVYEQIQDK